MLSLLSGNPPLIVNIYPFIVQVKVGNNGRPFTNHDVAVQVVLEGNT